MLPYLEKPEQQLEAKISLSQMLSIWSGSQNLTVRSSLVVSQDSSV